MTDQTHCKWAQASPAWIQATRRGLCCHWHHIICPTICIYSTTHLLTNPLPGDARREQIQADGAWGQAHTRIQGDGETQEFSRRSHRKLHLLRRKLTWQWLTRCLLTYTAGRTQKCKSKDQRLPQRTAREETIHGEKWGWGLRLVASVKVEGCESMFES